ncbi:LTA synthase family protein [Clostridium tetani]|uniref:LTA synthase family protein n=1 Tax=Clostridium tetani TaxID=1513 RepID=UPI00100B524F|nr:LTA synthase family protein [Clostridium tetani]RXI51951.1 LTA synthase family protein [Clostridium tetani]RXI57073.1 LTA synthase family protein [Clostridium tetani]RXM70697.1 LTA synthase family protein [Clostridium tetani]BDR78913.1 sulfatase [Clostridium tetani]
MKKTLNYIFKNFIDIIAFIVFLTIKLLIYGKTIETGYFTYKGIFFPVFWSLLVIIAFAILFKPIKRVKFLFMLNLVITLFIIADLNYFRYFKDVLSIPVILNSFQLGAVKSSVGSLIKLSDFLYFADLILFKFIIDHYKHSKFDRVILSKQLKFSAFLAIFILASSMEGYHFYKLSKEQPKLLSTMYNKVYIAKKLGNVNYHYLDCFNSLTNGIAKKTPIPKQKEEKVKAYLQTNITENATPKLKGIGENKNLIIIQVEALQSFAINKTINGKEITPNLNKWIKKSANFPNYFYQTASGGTSDAEFLSNNSLYPTASGSVTYLYAGNEFNALPEALKEKGYSTAGFHGFRESFWNRNIMYPKYGFDKFFGEKSYNVDEKIGLGLSDKSFLNQSLDKMKELKEPYFSFIVTLTSHFPYEAVDKYGDFPVGELENTLVGNYLKSIHYTDEQLGLFLDKLQQEKILDKSILAVYGDHYAIPKEHEKDLAKLLGKEGFTDLEWMELQKVPMFIHFPKDAHKGNYNIYGGQIDLYPTLANMFNLPMQNMLGKDLFNSKNGKVIFRNGSFSDGKSFYISPLNSYFNIYNGEKIEEDDNLKNLKEKTINELEYSDLILKHNLLKKFKNK